MKPFVSIILVADLFLRNYTCIYPCFESLSSVFSAWHFVIYSSVLIRLLVDSFSKIFEVKRNAFSCFIVSKT